MRGVSLLLVAIVMNDELKSIVASLKTNPGASEPTIAAMLKELGVCLPEEYLDLLRFSNGAEGNLVSDDGPYIKFWPAEEIVSSNQEYGIREDYPAVVIFGKNAATGAYGFDTNLSPMPVIEADFIDPEYYERRGNDLLDFLKRKSSV